MKERKKFNWWVVLTVICGLITATAIIFYVINTNMVLLLIILPGIAGTGFCVYKFANFGEAKFEGISERGPVTGDINAFCIYGRLVNGEAVADNVEFAKVDEKNLQGDRWYFEDLNKWLYVLFSDLKDEGKLKAFELPDAAYTDPARLAIQVNMGRTNELFQLDPSLFDQLKPWILFAAISVVGFLIFLSGSG